jgi:tRNA(Arg) A34 adenosine deaminase TadA
MFSEDDHSFMQAAMEEAHLAAARDEVPIGAVLVKKGEIIARNGNRTLELNDPTAHAEILSIREACNVEGMQRIPDYDLYVTLEPCTMCTGAIAFARIKRLIIGAIDPKGGGVLHGTKFFDQPTCHHKIHIDHGLMADECGQILKDYFKTKR